MSSVRTVAFVSSNMELPFEQRKEGMVKFA